MKGITQEVKRTRTIRNRWDEAFTLFGIVLIIFLALFA